MKPIRLELQGFTSFRDKVEIDFSNLDLFAITGPTGAGKTSLIDAIVYALYGATPRAGNNVSELITQGAKRTEVLLEFQAGPKRYRIGRTMRRGRTSVQSARRLEELREDGEWEPLTELEKETRQKVQEIIGLDFNGFTKSVVLPQGEFDRFLKGDPADRRKILTDLLQLRVYEEMGRRARDRSKDASARASTLKGQLDANFADATPENRKALKSELATAKRAREKLDGELAAVEAALPIAREIRRRRQQRDQAAADLRDVEAKLEKNRRSHGEMSERLEEHRGSVKALRQAIEKIGYDAGRHLALSALQPKADRLRKLERELSQHRERRGKLEERMATLRESIRRVEKERDEAERRRASCEAKLREAESIRRKALERHGPLETVQLLISELPQRSGRRKRLSELARRLEAQKREEIEAKEGVERLSGEAEAAERKLEEAKEELSELQLRHAAAHLRPRLRAGEPCPVCLQEVVRLPPEQEHPALASAEERVARREAEHQRLRGELAQARARSEAMPDKRRLLEESLADAREQAQAFDRRVQEALGAPPEADPTPQLEALSKRLRELESEVQACGKALQEAAATESAESARAAQARHELGLAERDVIAAETAMRKDAEESESLRAELADWPDPQELGAQLGELEEAHREKLRLEKLLEKARNDAESTHKKFQEAERETHLLEADRRRHLAFRDENQAALEGLEAALSESLPDWKPEPKPDEADQLSARRREFEKERSKAADLIARGEEKLAHLNERIKQAEGMRDQAKALEKQASVARELGRVLSAGRFITFIQEEALSRLGEGATLHLRSLSSDRYSFSVQSGNFHVLDHWNADEARPVTTLSGGESFLASLSLALSLAESLAEFCTDRERFSLESLFLDEGFSSLDPETLEIVVQAIESLVAGDRMIGAVSHIPELAERLPHRIQVRKSLGGSSVLVE